MVSTCKLGLGSRSLAQPVQQQQRPAARIACSSRKLVVSRAQAEAGSSSAGQHRRAFLGSLAAGVVAASLLATTPPAHAGPFLSGTGGKGVLAEKEQELYRLRQELESEARNQIEAERAVLEEEGRQSAVGKLCATPFGIDIVGITEFVALVGALVGGITARQRKAELERLNEQLRKINMSLRQQARAGTVYAPGLTYVPPIGGSSNGNGVSPDSPAAAPEVAKPVAATATITLPKPVLSPSERTLLSMEEEEMSVDQIQCRDALRAGKRFLKEANGAAAMVRFEKALMLSKALGDKVQERRAIRGLAASSRLQGQYRTAIGHLERVLEISKEMKEYTGDADAYGTIADCYTDLDMFEQAADYYDKYIQCMNKDGPV